MGLAPNSRYASGSPGFRFGSQYELVNDSFPLEDGALLTSRRGYCLHALIISLQCHRNHLENPKNPSFLRRLRLKNTRRTSLSMQNEIILMLFLIEIMTSGLAENHRYAKMLMKTNNSTDMITLSVLAPASTSAPRVAAAAFYHCLGR
jgi:hypothetical protein